MPIPAIFGLIGSVLGRKKDKEDAYQMQASPEYHGRTAPTIGQALSPQQQPPAGKIWDESTKSYIDDPRIRQRGAGFSNAMNTVGTIGSVIGGLGGNSQRQPYQMQMRR
jgi:hypothetical protein